AVKSLLIGKGADRIVLPEKGISPFHLVIGCDSNDFAVKVTKLILQYGGNPISDDGLTPVHIAAAWGRLEILTLLLASGGDPEAPGQDLHDSVSVCTKGGPSGLSRLDNVVFAHKILINNGRAIGEYEIVDEYRPASITKEKNLENLQNLPQSDPNENVIHWFATHVQATDGPPPFIKLPNGTGVNTSDDEIFVSFESSADESDNEHLRVVDVKKLTFRKAYTKTRRITNRKCFDTHTGKVTDFVAISTTYNFDKAKDFTRADNFSKESGIVTLQSSSNNDSILGDVAFVDAPNIDRAPKIKAVIEAESKIDANLEEVVKIGAVVEDEQKLDAVLTDLTSIKNTPKTVDDASKNDDDIEKAKDASSDYMTCSTHSLLSKRMSLK
ncbi:hypothetical protein NQ317_017951, partial [Molorchus minor]